MHEPPDDKRRFDLDSLPEEDFIMGWRLLTGEVPAAMLDDRNEMLRLLVESAEQLPVLPATRGRGSRAGVEERSSDSDLLSPRTHRQREPGA